MTKQDDGGAARYHEAARLRANEAVTLPRYQITRLETKLAKARAPRDEWRARRREAGEGE